MFRDLTANEIEVRIGQCNENGVSLLLYKDARVDMAILDDVLGQARWQREHYEVKGNLYCRVGIKIDNEWIWKSDCGTESNTEAEKGESSDSFKRACVNWGIGRELYTAPFIWINKNDCNLKEIMHNNKKVYKCNDNFSVVSVEIKAKTIVGLQIRNDKLGRIVYSFRVNIPPQQNNTHQPPPPQVPFPEADKKPQTAAQTRAEALAKERAWALDYIVEAGPRQGMKLGEVRKNFKADYLSLESAPPSIECAKAITIINEWVSGSQPVA